MWLSYYPHPKFNTKTKVNPALRFIGDMTSVAEPSLERETFIVRAVSTSHWQISSSSFLKENCSAAASPSSRPWHVCSEHATNYEEVCRTLCHIHIISHGSTGCVSALSASHAARIHTSHIQGRKPWAGKLLMTGSASCWRKMYATRLQRIVSSGRNNSPDVHQEAPVTHFGPGCNGGISISIVLRHGTGHGTMTATKIMREILEDNRKVNPSFQTRFPPVFNCTLPIRHQVSPARKSRVASFAFALVHSLSIFEPAC